MKYFFHGGASGDPAVVRPLRDSMAAVRLEMASFGEPAAVGYG